MVFLEMADDELFYIETEFAHASDIAIKKAINESIDELALGFSQLTKAEVRDYINKRIESRGNIALIKA
jgi:hypothetical protein